MISIKKATTDDSKIIAEIGRVSVGEAHRESCEAKHLDEYLDKNYNRIAIEHELNNPENIYHIIYYNEEPVGFSKIVLDAQHPNIRDERVTKLDRIYLLKEFQGLKLGRELLDFNIRLSQDHGQRGLWLFTWVGNQQAIDFYHRAGFKIVGSHDFYITPTHSNPNHQMYLSLHEK